MVAQRLHLLAKQHVGLEHRRPRLRIEAHNGSLCALLHAADHFPKQAHHAVAHRRRHGQLPQRVQLRVRLGVRQHGGGVAPLGQGGAQRRLHVEHARQAGQHFQHLQHAPLLARAHADGDGRRHLVVRACQRAARVLGHNDRHLQVVHHLAHFVDAANQRAVVFQHLGAQLGAGDRHHVGQPLLLVAQVLVAKRRRHRRQHRAQRVGAAVERLEKIGRDGRQRGGHARRLRLALHLHGCGFGSLGLFALRLLFVGAVFLGFAERQRVHGVDQVKRLVSHVAHAGLQVDHAHLRRKLDIDHLFLQVLQPLARLLVLFADLVRQVLKNVHFWRRARALREASARARNKRRALTRSRRAARPARGPRMLRTEGLPWQPLWPGARCASASRARARLRDERAAPHRFAVGRAIYGANEAPQLDAAQRVQHPAVGGCGGRGETRAGRRRAEARLARLRSGGARTQALQVRLRHTQTGLVLGLRRLEVARRKRRSCCEARQAQP